MPFVPVINVVKVALEFALPNAQTAVNVLHFEHDGAVALPDCVDITNLMFTWWDGNCKPLTSNQVRLDRVVATDLSVANSFQYINQPSTPDFGTLSSNVLPANVTFTTSFKTGLSGRSFRGRAYWVGLAESMVTGDIVLAASAQNIVDAWAELPATLAGTGWTHVVVSYISGGVPRSTGLPTPVILYTKFDDVVDTQRRRLTGHGS